MIGYGRNTFNDPYLLFKKKLDYDNYMAENIVPDGARFYARDSVDYRVQNTETNTAMVSHKYLTIETPSNKNFEIDDIIVSLKDGTKWRINLPTTADDGQMKQYSSRARKITILELVG